MTDSKVLRVSDRQLHEVGQSDEMMTLCGRDVVWRALGAAIHVDDRLADRKQLRGAVAEVV